MKKTTLLILTTMFFLIGKESFSQNNALMNLSNSLQSYYLEKDNAIIEKTINCINENSIDYDRIAPIFIGFYGALFQKDSSIKHDFASQIVKLKNEKFRMLFTNLQNTNIDSLYQSLKISPSYNDMNWSSFFATGDNKYIKQIVNNIKFAENRVDLNLFLAGSSAKWSLCSNAHQNPDVKKYLEEIKSENSTIEEILNKNPNEFQNEMIRILKEQKEKGIWR